MVRTLTNKGSVWGSINLFSIQMSFSSFSMQYHLEISASLMLTE